MNYVTKLSRYNRWWRLGKDFIKVDPDIKTAPTILKRKEVTIEAGKIYVIRGPRRAGKTFYMKLIIEGLLERHSPRSIAYIPCDRVSSRKELENLISDFITSNPHGNLFIFLDEVTYLPEWFLVVKDLAESDEFSRIAVVATGSSPERIKEKIERLPGRGVEGNEYWLMPLNFREFLLNFPPEILSTEVEKEELLALKEVLSHNSINPEDYDFELFHMLAPWTDLLNKLLSIYLKTGGFPEILLDYFKECRVSEEKLESLIRFIMGEVSKSGRSPNLAVGVFEELLKSLAGRTDYAKIARKLDVHHQTVRDLIEDLGECMVVFTLRHLNISDGRFYERKQKKFIFSDPGIIAATLQYIYGMDWDEIFVEMERMKPLIAECVLASSIITSLHVPYRREWWTRVGFYYDERGEIDAVLKGKKGVLGFEVKFDSQPVRMRRGVEMLVLTKDEFSVKERKVPLAVFLALLKKSERVL